MLLNTVRAEEQQPLVWELVGEERGKDKEAGDCSSYKDSKAIEPTLAERS